MTILYLLIFVIGLPTFSWGYVDPGSISIFLQVIFAFVLGGLISFRAKIIAGVKHISNIILAKKKPSYGKKPSPNKE